MERERGGEWEGGRERKGRGRKEIDRRVKGWIWMKEARREGKKEVEIKYYGKLTIMCV